MRNFVPVTALVFCLLCFPGRSCAQGEGEHYETGRLAVPAEAATTWTAGPGHNYLIKKGDTLWDLAIAFLGDPFNWPSIWKLNPYISDPHWIYPGNELVINGSGFEFAHTADGTTGRPPQGLTFDEITAGFLDGTAVASADTDQADTTVESELTGLKNILAKRVLTSDFRTRLPFLCRTKDEKGLSLPGVGRIDIRAEKELFHQYDEIPIKTFRSNVFSTGDTIDVFQSGATVSVQGTKGTLVQRTGRARVTSMQGNSGTALLFAVMDAIKAGDRIGAATTIPSVPIDGFAEPPTTIAASVVCRVGTSLFPYLYDTFLIDKGSSAGIKAGDLFATFSTASSNKNHLASLVACAALVETDYCTMVIVKLVDNSLRPGDRAELVMSPIPIL